MSDTEHFYQSHIFVCQNERPEGHPRGCCQAAGATRLRNYMKVRVKELGLPETRVNTAGCLDRCELGPVMVIYPQGTWYRYENQDDIEEILQTHLIEGRVVDRLQLQPDQ
ncbi:(2Fe-2S) ferredoxin domain-containing protein [uncultured Thalassospira sp.]|uniref:(2Fe-2S) ferredoxin domain-containing protein n=1 Tax=uncultured Thalassospira sp. TaxID=404382 RepID=UPI0030DA1437